MPTIAKVKDEVDAVQVLRLPLQDLVRRPRAVGHVVRRENQPVVLVLQVVHHVRKQIPLGVQGGSE